MSDGHSSITVATILVVDATTAHLKLLSSMLLQYGHTVRSAQDGKTALTVASAAPPDVILLNIRLPDMSGYELCQHLKQDERTHTIPVIFINAFDEVFNKVRAFAVGGADSITAPFHHEEVLARIQHQVTIRALQRQLQHQVESLQDLKSRLQRELVLAHDIQQSLLPSPTPGWSDLDVICFNAPAREVGGDLYAYHRLATQRYALAVGDVSGKGMPAALLMAVSEALLRSCIAQVLPPAALLAQMDQALHDYTRPTRQNCALLYLDIIPDSLSCKLRVANAGGIPPLIKHTDGSLTWVDVGGLPLGLGLGFEPNYQEVSLEVQNGDTIILMSDGVVEAKNSQEELLGFERLEQLAAATRHTNAADLLAFLQFELFSFMGNTQPHDDMTLIVAQL